MPKFITAFKPTNQSIHQSIKQTNKEKNQLWSLKKKKEFRTSFRLFATQTHVCTTNQNQKQKLKTSTETHPKKTNKQTSKKKKKKKRPLNQVHINKTTISQGLSDNHTEERCILRIYTLDIC
eukprot:m.86844 g.86844  ORF g.86844 m.86844 type:complete len:122 (-) comp14483_c0_seq2:2207-2572(-)